MLGCIEEEDLIDRREQKEKRRTLIRLMPQEGIEGLEP